MANLEDLFDVAELERLIEEKYVNRRVRHDGYVLLNYAPRAQWESLWVPETIHCRGLVADPDGRIQSRPFSKFFNVSEHENPNLPPLPLEPFEVYEKVDGSLIVVSRMENGELLFTTRGSFDSAQAQSAARLWQDLYSDVDVPPGETWLFEFVAPWNRIVVEYGYTDLILLAAIDNETGKDLPLPAHWPGRCAKFMNGIDDFEEILSHVSQLGDNEEGFVILFESGVRAKIKGDTYLRLHKTLTGTSRKTIWEFLSSGQGVQTLLDRVPDEFFAWVNTTTTEFQAKYNAIDDEAVDLWESIKDLPNRKAQALAIANSPLKAIVFRMLDGKDYSEVIWKGLRPPPITVDSSEDDLQVWKMEQ